MHRTMDTWRTIFAWAKSLVAHHTCQVHLAAQNDVVRICKHAHKKWYLALADLAPLCDVSGSTHVPNEALPASPLVTLAGIYQLSLGQPMLFHVALATISVDSILPSPLI